jgi:NUC194 domain
VSGGSFCLIAPLLPALREGTSHRYHTWLVDAFRSFASSVTPGGALDGVGTETLHSGVSAAQAVCGYCLSVITDEREDLSVKEFLFDSMCVPVLTSCSLYVLETLLCDTWGAFKVVLPGFPVGAVSVSKRLYELTQKEIKPIDTKYTADTLSFLQACCYKMVEVSYDRLPLTALKGAIARSYSGPDAKGNEFTGAVSKAAYKFLRTAVNPTVNPVVAQRLYSAAFNCLALIVAKTQSEEKFFDMFLFKEKPGERVWGRLVDCTVTYQFKSDTEKFETVFLGPRDVPSGGGARGMGRRGRDSLGVGSFMSQYLTGSFVELSSLMTHSQLTPFGSKQLGGKRASASQSQSQVADYEDLGLGSSQSGVGGSQYELPSARAIQQREEEASGVVCGLDDNVIALEMNDVNTQPCMGALLRAIQRMSFLFSSDGDDAKKGGKWRADIMPNWVAEIRDRLSDYSTGSRNVRLFMLRLLLNQPVASIVAVWAVELLPSVVECCIEDLCDPAVGEGYHYFLRDVVFTICDSWSVPLSGDYSDDPGGGIQDATHTRVAQLTSYLIKHAYNETAEVLKANVRSIGALVRLFKVPKGMKGHIALRPVVSLLTVEAGPTGGANASAKSKGSEGVRKRLTGLSLLQVSCHTAVVKATVLSATGCLLF